MLSKQNDQKMVTRIFLTGLLTLLASCGSGSSAIESLVQADPKLIESGQKQESDTTSSETSQDLAASPQTENQVIPEGTPPETSNEIANEAASQDDPVEPETEISGLPESFPASFPIYPQAELRTIKPGKTDASGMITWNSPDNRKAIADFYQAQLTANNWEIVKPFVLNPQQKVARAIAVKNDRRVALTLVQSEANEVANNGTTLSVIYQPLSQEVAESGISQAMDSETETTNTNPEPKIAKPSEPDEVKSSPDFTDEGEVDLPAENENYSVLTADFSDLDDVPEQLSQPIETIAALGILTPYTGEGNIELSKFAPNATITRGEYARWLIAANNRYYEDNPGKKIYTANNTSQPAFTDVKGQHPDFGAIQGLAEAGLIPSRLTDHSSNLLFRPDAPLTREDLVTWKVPLDLRQALPKASIQAIEESWGFQDAADIDSSAIRALYADFQNGDLSNVRRIFGFTTLFQPNKPVTRAEAAASLWYFGFQGDGITAREVLETETQLEADS